MIELNTILEGNCLDHLRSMPDDFIQCVVTSPPYYGLRAYRTEPVIWDGDAHCQHIWGETLPFSKQDNRTAEQKVAQGSTVGSNIDFNDENTTADSGSFCQQCSAWRGELGLEPRFQDYIRHLLQIFAEVKRVLKPDGCVFVNLGDSYASSGGASRHFGYQDPKYKNGRDGNHVEPTAFPQSVRPKSLFNIPHRFFIGMTENPYTLRKDLTDEQRRKVITELAKRGII